MNSQKQLAKEINIGNDWVEDVARELAEEINNKVIALEVALKAKMMKESILPTASEKEVMKALNS